MKLASSESSHSKTVFLDTLRHPNYAKLLTGQVVAAFGDRINQIAILNIVIGTGHTAKYSADIMFWATLPAVVLGPFAVALIDRWNRRKTMFTSDMARALLVMSIPILMIYIHHHYVIYSLVFLLGIFSALFGACRLAIMPSLIPQNFLMSANAISSQAGNIGTLVAVPLGAGIVSSFGQNTSFLINAGTYLISALFIWHLKPSSNSKKIPHHHPFEDFKLGLRYIWQTKPVLFYAIFTAFVHCLMAVFFVCFLSYGVDVVSQNPHQKLSLTGLLFLFLGIGMTCGALWLGRFSNLGERFLWPMVMLTITGLGIFLLSKITHPWFSALTLFGTGFFALMVLAPLDTFLQKRVPYEYRGRVFAARGVLVGFGFLISLQFSKGIIKHAGILSTFELLGIAALIIGFISLWIGKQIAKKDRSGILRSIP